ncbi:Flp1 family type IVb pilin [Ferviditalea candida]|uniref:Flp1 family type IVb pilin n=1 Tax=Ferviditalea candida TaxID=3108399 RepID=A0ABU5ZJP4_9BACL|nr:Flp1 family type IVb pilin [Paenibacillaceae bacterium T2]
MQYVWNRLRQLYRNEEGISTLEIILIIAVIVIIAIAFRKWIMHWVQKLFDGANSKMQETSNNDPLNVIPSSNP